ILKALRETQLEELNHIIWKYNFGVYTKTKYVSSHYHILFYKKPGKPHTFNTYARYGALEKTEDGGRMNYIDREDVWIINREYKPGRVKNKNELPTALLTKMIRYSSNEGAKRSKK
ncbi:MAG: DNA methyltransferase, partial [Anaerolineales bacterium]